MLEKVQKKATKLIPELKNMVYIDHLKLLKLPTLHYRQVRGDMIEMYKILYGKYGTAVTPRVTSRGEMVLGWRKVDQNMTCISYFLLIGKLIFGTVYLTMSCHVTLLINLNTILIISGNIKILCMTMKLKFAEP